MKNHYFIWFNTCQTPLCAGHSVRIKQNFHSHGAYSLVIRERKKTNQIYSYSSINAMEKNKEDRRVGVLGGSCYFMVVKERIFGKVVFQ